MEWDNVRFFLAAAHAGSLTAASRLLGSHQPTVGRRIDALEKSLGIRLFQRHVQGLTLTDEGRRILLAAEAMEEASWAVQRNSGKDDELRGNVSIAVTGGLAVQIITPALVKFHQDFPQLDVNLIPSADSADLIHGEAEIAVRLYRPVEGDLVTRKVGTMGFGLYGARAYFQRQGIPKDMVDLPRHNLIGYGKQLRHADESRWLEEAANECRFLLRSDDTHVRLAAAEAGVGLAVLPHFLARNSPDLQATKLGPPIPARSIWVVVHQDLRNLAKVRAVFDWLSVLLRDIPSR